MTKWHMCLAKTQISLGMKKALNPQLPIEHTAKTRCLFGFNVAFNNSLVISRRDSPLLQSFGWDFKPRARLHDLVVSGTLKNSKKNSISRRCLVVTERSMLWLRQRAQCSGCNRELNAHFYSAATLKYHTQDTWHAETDQSSLGTQSFCCFVILRLIWNFRKLQTKSSTGWLYKEHFISHTTEIPFLATQLISLYEGCSLISAVDLITFTLLWVLYGSVLYIRWKMDIFPVGRYQKLWYIMQGCLETLLIQHIHFT